MLTKVSIITPCYTDERLSDIKQLIDSIASQTNQHFESLIVAERSVDILHQIEQYIQAKKYPNIRVLFNPGPNGLSVARNLAIRQARGDILAFVDDDAVLDPQWVAQIIASFQEDKSIVGVTGPILPLWENARMNWFPPEFYWIFSCTSNDPVVKTEVRNGYGTNLSFERQAILDHGLFNPDLGIKGHGKKGWQEPGAEETEMSFRLKKATGKRIIFNPEVKVQHKVYAYRISRRFIMKRAYWEGYGKSLLKSRLRRTQDANAALTTEHTLLKKILFYRIPLSIGLLFRKPRVAALQLGVIGLVLPSVATGYLFRLIFARKK